MFPEWSSIADGTKLYAGGYVYQPQDDTDALLADHEERLIYMELGV